MSATPCDRCGEPADTLIYVGTRLLCFPCHAIEHPTPAPKPAPLQPETRVRGHRVECHCGLCTAPVLPGFLPGFEAKA